MVVTFERHPRQVLHSDWCPQLLSTLDEKLEQLSQTGIDFLVVLQFDEAMASLSAHDFMHDILCQRLGVKVLVTGYDNRFGHNRTEGFDDYVRYGREMGMAVVQGDPIEVSSIRVSSSKVRRLLAEGLVEQAAECLGRPYMLSGRVVCGEHIGREMGFPTANLQLADDGKLIPASGVYAVKVKLEGSAELYHGMMNIGSRPTFGGQHQTLETHIFHFGGDIYGQQMTVLFVSRLRSEKRFDSREALMLQLESDLHQAEEKLAK
jgi:riboflavin kinase/FMN adenylyltransferase